MSICTSLNLYFKMGPPMSENRVKDVGLRAEYPIWLEHKCSGI